MILKGNSPKPLPDPLYSIGRKNWLKAIWCDTQDNPCNWDMQFKYILKKASSQLHVFRVCKFYGYTIDDLHLLFKSFVMPILCFSIEVWGWHIKKST